MPAKPALQLIRKVDLNLADSGRLAGLLGNKYWLAGRIIRYREKLGGFIHQQQLKEVYGLSDQLYQTLKTNVFIGVNFEPKRINMFEVDFKTLISHPYIDYNLAKLLLRFRDNCDEECNYENLFSLKLIDTIQIQKLKRYLE